MLTEKQQAILVLALASLKKDADSRHDGPRIGYDPRADEAVRAAMVQIIPAARILTDQEIVPLIVETLSVVMNLSVTPQKITPDPTDIPLQ